MKKLWMVLAILALVGSAFAHEGMDAPSGKKVTLSGTLVDVNCYLKDGHTGDDHDSMKKCGRDCLNDGLPAGLLVGKMLYVIIFPGPVFADCVGKTVEVSGTVKNGSMLLPEKAFVVEKDKKKPIKLTGKVMM